MRTRARRVAMALAVSALLAGCSSGSSGGNTAAGAPTTVGTATTAGSATTVTTGTAPTPTPSFNNHGSKTVTGSTITLEADNYYFEPSIIRGKPGQKITVKVENASATEHNFTVKSQHVDVDIDGHETKTAVVTIPKSGFLSFYCEYHQSKGMAGLLESTSG